MIARPFHAAVWAVAFAIGLSATAIAQDTGTVRGSVTDPAHRAAADAVIVIRNGSTNAITTGSSDRSGRFTFDGLPAGSYSIEIAAPGFDIVRRQDVVVTAAVPATVDVELTLANVRESVTVSAALPHAAAAAPSQGSLTARSAESLISNEFIRNYTSPVSDYSQVLLMAPSTFSVSTNGPGLGDTKTFFRGFKDGYYSMTFDGVPFNDTNDPTHHSWVFFPAQTIGSTVFERSPGDASTIGPSTFGGSVNLLSRGLASRQQANVNTSYGSFNTRLLDVEYSSGAFGPGQRSRLMLDAHRMESDGYQTFNSQKRDAGSLKYEYRVSNGTTISVFSSVMDLHSNTPNQKGATRAQIAQFGDNFLMSGDPTSPLYYKFNFYHIPTHFEYVGLKSDLGRGWSIDNKAYTMRYYNKQNYNSVSSISATSATDKLNSYWKMGNVMPITHVSSLGILKTGVWFEWASTDRYQTPSDPRTWVNAALPNFHEQFITTTAQPFVQYALKLGQKLTVTSGVKYARYQQDFTQFADNGKTVGNLGGNPFVRHTASYRATLPSIDAHYLMASNWSAYAQAGRGQNIPPTSVFDVKGAQVGILPKPILANTLQIGSVWKSDRATLDVDAYHIAFDADYSSTYDAVSGDTLYFANGTLTTKGVEAESTVLLGGGLALYLNATKGSSRYDASGLWSQNAPSDTETVGLTYNTGRWNIGSFAKRIGTMYNDNGAAHQAIRIDPFAITNLFVNFTIGGRSMLSDSRLRLAVNNLIDTHAVTGVSAASTASSAPAPGDILTKMAGRSVSLSLSVGLHQ
mgnify:CR=1 FL=1